MTTTRAARDTDATAIAELLTQLGYPVVPASVPGRLAKMQTADSIVLLAVDDHDNVVGLGTAVAFAAMHTDTPVAYITALVTNESVRGHGVGRRMITALELWARERGCPRLSVTSGEHRHDAHSFYVQCGFPQTGRRFTKGLDASAS